MAKDAVYHRKPKYEDPSQDNARPAKIPLNKAMSIMSNEEIISLSQPINVKSKKMKPKKQTYGGGSATRNMGKSA